MKLKSFGLTILLFIVLVLVGQIRVKVNQDALLSCSSSNSISSSASDQQQQSSESGACPVYFEWIARDLSPWRASGITELSIAEASWLGSMRVIIVQGRLFAEFYNKCPHSRRSFTLLGLLMLLERFPGQVPDVDLVINCNDRPVVSPSASSSAFLLSRRLFFGQLPPPPVLSYCKTSNTSDIPFPDFSFWGWPELNIPPWEQELEEVVAGSKQVAWEKREPVAFWKGNAWMGRWRKFLLGCNSTHTAITQQNWLFESGNGFRNSRLQDQCKQRYNIYVEGAAWSASFKYKLACGSTLLRVDSEYEEFFSRALVPGKHYVAVATNDICQQISEAVEWGNSNEKEAEEIGKNGQKFVHQELSMPHVYDYLFHLLSQYAKLQRFSPAVPRGAQQICKSSLQHQAADLISNPRSSPCILT